MPEQKTELTEIIRLGNTLWEGRDLVEAFNDEEFVSQHLGALSGSPVIDPDFDFQFVGPPSAGGDIGQVRRGMEGLITEWREWLKGWEDFRVEFGPPLDLGDGRVFQRVRSWGRSRSAKVELEAKSAGIYTFREGKLVASRHYLYEQQALEVAGLSE
jgi:hypothetical protein